MGSEYMAKELGRHGFEPQKTRVLPLFSPDVSNSVESEVGRNGLLFVGSLIRGKGLDLLLKALADLNRATLRVIGDGPQREYYRGLADQLNLGDRVQFLGKMAPQCLVGYYREAEALVLPSRSPETFGLVGVEAMSHATPVIAARVGAIGEWLEHGVTGLSFPSGDVVALRTAVERLLARPESARDMGRKGRKLYEQRYRPHTHLKLLQNLIEEIVP